MNSPPPQLKWRMSCLPLKEYQTLYSKWGRVRQGRNISLLLHAGIVIKHTLRHFQVLPLLTKLTLHKENAPCFSFFPKLTGSMWPSFDFKGLGNWSIYLVQKPSIDLYILICIWASYCQLQTVKPWGKFQRLQPHLWKMNKICTCCGYGTLRVWAELCPPAPKLQYVKPLFPDTCKCELTYKESLCRCNQVKRCHCGGP